MPTHFLALALVFALQPSSFDARFTGRTLRFDYFHSGTAKEEHVSLDGLRLEGDWPGSRVRLLDDTNLGKYLFEVIDLATNQALYSRGFSSIYGEWETTGEAAAGTWRTFHESMRFPEPRGKVQLVLKKRGAGRRLPRDLLDRRRSGEPLRGPLAGPAARARSGASSRAARRPSRSTS